MNFKISDKTKDLRSLPVEVVNQILDLPVGKYEIKPFIKDKTRKQENAVHKYCRFVAQALNEKGKPRYGSINGKEMRTPWTMENIKYGIWAEFQLAMFNTISIRDLKTKQVNEIFKMMYGYLAENHGIEVEFPNISHSK